MTHEPTSLQKQSPLSEAQDAVEKARHAAAQAQSRPTPTMLHQAEQALAKAERAVAQAAGDDNKAALAQLAHDFEGVEQRVEAARRATADTQVPPSAPRM